MHWNPFNVNTKKVWLSHAKKTAVQLDVMVEKERKHYKAQAWKHHADDAVHACRI